MEEEKKSLDGIPGLFAYYEDGSIKREPPAAPQVPACKDFVNGVATEDVCINAFKGTWARIFLPELACSSNEMKVPLVLHFHGGGLVTGSPSDASYHAYCSRMAFLSCSIWISVAYRLAPEHRVPAQYDDCLESLCWLRAQFTQAKDLQERNGVPVARWDPGLNQFSDQSTSQLSAEKQRPWWNQHHCASPEEHIQEPLITAELLQQEPWRNKDASPLAYPHPWLIQYGDPSRVFCTGESAGATILHYVTLRISQSKWSPIRICGLIFVDIGVLADPLPEWKPSMDAFLTPGMMYASVRFSLPVNAKLGDPLLDCLHPVLPSFSERTFPRAMVFGADRDLLYEHSLKYFKALQEGGNDADLHVTPGEGHCFHLLRPDTPLAKLREGKLAEFIQTL